MEVGSIFIGEYGVVEIVKLSSARSIRYNDNYTTIVSYKYVDEEHDSLDVNGSCFLPRFKEKFKQICKATRLAKKLYPDAEVSECGEWIYV